MIIRFVLLIIATYLLGALPVSNLVARARGIDLRRYGTGQVGTGNLLRATSSWKISLPVGIYDCGKGALMVWVASLMGLSMVEEAAIGLATVIGHNWSVFLGFSGGRGVVTAIGLLVVLPLVNDLWPWAIVTFLVVGFSILPFTRSTPLPVLAGLAAVPLASLWLHEPVALTLGFLAILLVIVVKRLMAQPLASSATVSRRELVFNRLFFDRDIRDRKAWVYRKPEGREETKGPESK